jgi:hypothetical protein
MAGFTTVQSVGAQNDIPLRDATVEETRSSTSR